MAVQLSIEDTQIMSSSWLTYPGVGDWEVGRDGIPSAVDAANDIAHLGSCTLSDQAVCELTVEDSVVCELTTGDSLV